MAQKPSESSSAPSSSASNAKDEPILSLDDEDYPEFWLLGKDGYSFRVNREEDNYYDPRFLPNMTQTAMSVEEYYTNPTGGKKYVFPVNVNGKIAEHIVRYKRTYIEAGKSIKAPVPPLKSRHMKDNVFDPYDAEFIDDIHAQDPTNELLFELTRAANYLDEDELTRLCAAKIASLLRGNPMDKFNEILYPGRSSSSSSPGMEVKDNSLARAPQPTVDTPAPAVKRDRDTKQQTGDSGTDVKIGAGDAQARPAKKSKKNHRSRSGSRSRSRSRSRSVGRRN